jgi:hypothetical protein
VLSAQLRGRASTRTPAQESTGEDDPDEFAQRVEEVTGAFLVAALGAVLAQSRRDQSVGDDDAADVPEGEGRRPEGACGRAPRARTPPAESGASAASAGFPAASAGDAADPIDVDLPQPSPNLCKLLYYIDLNFFQQYVGHPANDAVTLDGLYCVDDENNNAYYSTAISNRRLVATFATLEDIVTSRWMRESTIALYAASLFKFVPKVILCLNPYFDIVRDDTTLWVQTLTARARHAQLQGIAWKYLVATLCIDSHYIVIVVDYIRELGALRLFTFDSMRPDRLRASVREMRAMRIVRNALACYGRIAFVPVHCAQQMDQYSCGIYAIHFLRCISLDMLKHPGQLNFGWTSAASDTMTPWGGSGRFSPSELRHLLFETLVKDAKDFHESQDSRDLSSQVWRDVFSAATFDERLSPEEVAALVRAESARVSS